MVNEPEKRAQKKRKKNYICQLIFHKEAKSIHWKTIIFSKSNAGKNQMSICKKKKKNLNTNFMLFTKIKMICRHKCKRQNYKILTSGRKLTRKIGDLGFRGKFLYVTPKP